MDQIPSLTTNPGLSRIMTAEYYNTIDKASVAEFKDRGSRFIAFAYPIKDINDFKEKLAALKKEHGKATHHCFAYRLGLGGNIFRSSDDGEPSGSAGKPILGQIDSKQLTDVMIVVVRYFGGALLGVPGLINAYKTVAALALQVTPIVQKAILVNYHLQFDYTQMNEVMRILKQCDCVINRQEIVLFCTVDIGIPKHRVEEVLYKLRGIQGISIESTS